MPRSMFAAPNFVAGFMPGWKQVRVWWVWRRFRGLHTGEDAWQAAGSLHGLGHAARTQLWYAGVHVSCIMQTLGLLCVRAKEVH